MGAASLLGGVVPFTSFPSPIDSTLLAVTCPRCPTRLRDGRVASTDLTRRPHPLYTSQCPIPSPRRHVVQVAQAIAPCLWFDDQAEEAAKFYTAIFPNSKIVAVTRYSEAGQEIHGKKPGSVMTVEFELNGQTFTALNGGPHLQVQRGDLVPGPLRHAGRDRPLLGEAVRRAATRRPSSAAGSRTSSACRGRSSPAAWPRCSRTPSPKPAKRAMAAVHADEEARHRRAPEGLRGLISPSAAVCPLSGRPSLTS